MFDQRRHVPCRVGNCFHALHLAAPHAYAPAMTADVLAATLIAPGHLELQRFPFPEELEPGAVLLKMLASGICGTDKHTFRGETQQYAGTDHASSTPFPIIQGHENVGIVTAIGEGGATAFDGSSCRPATVWCRRRIGRAENASSAAAIIRTTSAADSRTMAIR